MYYIIVNPASKSGKGLKIWSQIEPVLIEKKIKYKLYFSKKIGHVSRLVRKLSASLADGAPDFILKLIILGGDGTLNEAIQGISDFNRVHLGYIPTGSSNDLARDLHLPKDPVKILESILSCQTPSALDLGKLTYDNCSGELSRQHSNEDSTSRLFAVSCGIGFDAAVCEEALASRFKNILNKIGLGKLTYLTIALKQLIKAKKITCKVTLDDAPPIYLPKFLFVACMIHQYEGGGFKFCPDANACDGLTDICVVGNIPKWLIVMALPTAFFGKHYIFQGIDHYTAHKIQLETSAPLWVHTDGEVTRKSSSITITGEKQKLQFLL